LYDSETRTLKKRDWNLIQAAEIKYLQTVKGCAVTDQLRNGDVGNKFCIFPLCEKSYDTEINGKMYSLMMEQTRIPPKPINITLRIDER
jgi:hypothetical protein